MNVSRAIRKLAMAAAVSVAALPMLAQAFISVSTVNDAENLVESTLTLGGNTLGSASFSRLNGLRLESLDRTGAPASVGDTALAYNNHNELTGYGSGTGSDFAYTRDAGTGWIEGVGSSGSHVRDDSLSVERDAAGWITRESGNHHDIAYEYRDDGVRTATVQHGRRCVHAVTAAGAPAFRRGAEPVGRFRAPEESSGDYYIVGPLPGQYPCISNALDAVYADYGSTSFPSRVTVLLETNALAEAVALDAAVWPLAPASGAELVVRGQRGGTALTGSLDVRGIAHVRLERLLLSGGTTFTNAPSATLRNSVADAPVAFFGVDGAVVAGCTFVYTNGLAAVAVTNSPAALFRDNLVLGGGGACGAVLDAATVTADHNAWWPVAPPALGTGDVFADPLVDGDYWISSPLSPLVRTGVSMSGLDADIAGMRRYASAPCIGAHEYGIEATERDTEGRVSRRVFNGRACEYAYDAYGRLIAFTDVAANTAASYEYDFAGRRVGMAVGGARTVMVYDWGGHDVVHETHDANGDGDLNDSGDYRRTYWVLPEIDRRIGFVDELPGGATETYWYVCDANGSVHAVVDADGTVANRYAYDSFGVIDWDWSYETVPNRYAFQGREYDAERGDYHFRNRVYMPEWGLFSGPDMNLAAGPYGEAHGMMSYVFCGNDPWTYADPMGLAFGDWWDCRTHAFIAEGFFGGMGKGATVMADHATLGLTGLHDDAVEYQAEARRNGDVLSQIGFGAGKLGVDAATFLAGGAIVNGAAKTAQGTRVAAKVADVIVKHPKAVSHLAKTGAVLLSGKAGFDAGQAVNAGLEGDWETLTYKAGSAVIDLALVRSAVSGIRQMAAEKPVVNVVDTHVAPVANSQAVAPKTIAGAGDDMATVYRGVHGNHPQFQNAINGKASPWGGHADAALHNAGNNQSVFTSWSTDYKTAVDFALQEGPGGVVLKQTVPRSSLITSPDVFSEFEVLRMGPIEGATPIILSP